MPRLGQNEFGRTVGLSSGTISKKVKKGDLKVGPDGKIDLDEGRAALRAARSVQHGYMDEVNEAQREKARAARGEAPSRPPADGFGLPDDDQASTTRSQFNKARTIRETFVASTARLEFQQRSGALIERAMAERVLFSKARHARDAWLSWPSRTAPIIAAELGLDNADALLHSLAKHVHAQISALGASDVADFSADNGA
jgi:hypothetical protein